MTDNDVNPTTLDDQAMLVDSVFDAAPVVPGKVGHHTVLSVGEARVIALSFDQGQQMKEHRSHHPLILQALDGHVQVTAAGRTLDLRPGALMYLPNALPHSVEALAPSRVILTPIGIAP
ncbi:MAG TPA: cupin domain-containing protein [Pseudonocardia sp.]|jgi:quercetin dioxygenase-like cupin family protein|nr:cupin domain-containing protein [Pseudonocardia sp.]